MEMLILRIFSMPRKLAMNNNYNKYNKHNIQKQQGFCLFVTMGTCSWSKWWEVREERLRTMLWLGSQGCLCSSWRARSWRA